MELEDLRSFALVVKHDGFSSAERASGVARAKLSKRVARLELELGARLLERSTRSIRITDVGMQVYRQCEVIADSIAAARSAAENAREEVSGRLRVSCPPGLARYLGAERLSSFLAQYPMVQMEMHVTSRKVDIIREGFDIALRITPEIDTDLSLTMRQFARSQRILVASPTLIASTPPIDFAALSRLPTLTTGEHRQQHKWDLLDPDGQLHKLLHQPRLCSNDSLIVREAALNGMGIALLYEESCREDLAQGRLMRVLPGWHTAEGIMHMIFATRKGMSAAQRAFIDHYATQPATAWQPTLSPTAG